MGILCQAVSGSSAQCCHFHLLKIAQHAPIASVLLSLLCGLPAAEENRMFIISQPPSVAQTSDGNAVEQVTVLFQTSSPQTRQR